MKNERFTYVPLAVLVVIVFVIAILVGEDWKANLIYAVAAIVFFISLPFTRMAGRKFLESEFYRNNRGSAILVQVCGGAAACALAFLIYYFLKGYSWEMKIFIPIFFLGLIFNLLGILPIRTRKRLDQEP